MDITLVVDHCMCMQIFQEGALAPGIPYYLKVEENKRDITAELDVDKDLWAKVPERMPLLSEVNQQCVAASAMQVIGRHAHDAGALGCTRLGLAAFRAGCPGAVDASGARWAVTRRI